MIRALVFDVGGVVCTFDPDRRLDALARETGLERAYIHHAIWASGLEERAEVGALPAVGVERTLLDVLEGRIDALALRKAWSSAFTADPAVCALVMSVELPCFAFTNNGPMFTDCLAHELAPVRRCFERVICSWQLRARKPDPVAFERLCRELCRAPENLLFIDDNADNVMAARSVGLTALVYESVTRLAEDLAAH